MAPSLAGSARFVQPSVTFRCSSAAYAHVRRSRGFGPDPRGAVYWTLFNDSSTLQKGLLRPDYKGLHVDPSAAVTELISEGAVRTVESGWELELASQEAKVIELMLGKK